MVLAAALPPLLVRSMPMSLMSSTSGNLGAIVSQCSCNANDQIIKTNPALIWGFPSDLTAMVYQQKSGFLSTTLARLSSAAGPCLKCLFHILKIIYAFMVYLPMGSYQIRRLFPMEAGCAVCRFSVLLIYSDSCDSKLRKLLRLMPTWLDPVHLNSVILLLEASAGRSVQILQNN